MFGGCFKTIQQLRIKLINSINASLNFQTGVFFGANFWNVSIENYLRLKIKPKLMIEKLIAFFKRPFSETTNEIPKGICPNCWGKQEYDKVIRDLYQDHQIDLNNGQANHNFIQNVVVNKIEGIKLKKGNTGLVCSACSTK